MPHLNVVHRCFLFVNFEASQLNYARRLFLNIFADKSLHFYLQSFCRSYTFVMRSIIHVIFYLSIWFYNRSARDMSFRTLFSYWENCDSQFRRYLYRYAIVLLCTATVSCSGSLYGKYSFILILKKRRHGKTAPSFLFALLYQLSNGLLSSKLSSSSKSSEKRVSSFLCPAEATVLACALFFTVFWHLMQRSFPKIRLLYSATLESIAIPQQTHEAGICASFRGRSLTFMVWHLRQRNLPYLLLLNTEYPSPEFFLRSG